MAKACNEEGPQQCLFVMGRPVPSQDLDYRRAKSPGMLEGIVSVSLSDVERLT